MYNNGNTYPDLKVIFSEGSDVRVHRGIVCSNEWFKKVVAPVSATTSTVCFGDADFRCPQSTTEIHLGESRKAGEIVLRNLYGFALPSRGSKSWRVWGILSRLARNCRDPELSAKAKENLFEVARSETDANVVIEILGAVASGVVDSNIIGFDTMLRKHHAIMLLRNETYRKQLGNNAQLLWMHLDQFVDKG